ncbi:hypothetical protein [Staphylococcus chromogenes]|uniref:hypothetical protein n=1 Tax=Staphylococcus chromogenes TaxID=46126 RepID=UPI001E5755B3|nr:hypothetical protein [Staphylococcus chromogenes]MCD9070642.1 hypothetical protein [Staphylococcus chromogenes]
MAKVDYKRIWQEFKQQRIEEYVMLQRFFQKYPRIGEYKTFLKLAAYDLKSMDKLDGTKEFENLLHGLRRLHGDDPKQ